jgi:3',5'-cyclic AMP phosphodiesterase CpdA
LVRIAYTSDLHIDVSDRNRDGVASISKLVREARPDVVIVAGDAGNTIEALDEALSYFDGVDARKFFVPGNHDVWIESEDGELVGSRSKYERLIPEACRRRGFHDLGREPVVIGDVGFVGSLGWYDYSFADPRLGLREDVYWKGRYGDEIWWDKKMTYWVAPADSGPARRSGGEAARERMRDTNVCREMTARLEADLRSIEDRVTKIIAVIHTLPFFVGIPRSEPPYYLDGYTGSARLGEVLQAHKKVEHCIHGHKHTSGEWTVGGIRTFRRVLGRLDDECSVEETAGQAVGFIDL